MMWSGSRLPGYARNLRRCNQYAEICSLRDGFAGGLSADSARVNPLADNDLSPTKVNLGDCATLAAQVHFVGYKKRGRTNDVLDPLLFS